MMNRIVIQLIRGYQRWCAPFLMPSCRFYPSCSEYAAEVFNRYGLFKAFGFAFLRLIKCHPWHQGGVDLVK